MKPEDLIDCPNCGSRKFLYCQRWFYDPAPDYSFSKHTVIVRLPNPDTIHEVRTYWPEQEFFDLANGARVNVGGGPAKELTYAVQCGICERISFWRRTRTGALLAWNQKTDAEKVFGLIAKAREGMHKGVCPPFSTEAKKDMACPGAPDVLSDCGPCWLNWIQYSAMMTKEEEA